MCVVQALVVARCFVLVLPPEAVVWPPEAVVWVDMFATISLYEPVSPAGGTLG